MSGGFGVGEVCTVASSVTMVGLVIMPVLMLDLFDLSASGDTIVACNLFAAGVLSRVRLLAAELRCTSGCAERRAAGKL